jgi:hypothetical protein
MSALCYICKKGNVDSDPIYSCNNCGGLVCEDHGRYFAHSKHCSCTSCFPRNASAHVELATDTFSHMNIINENMERYAQKGLPGFEKISALIDRLNKDKLLKSIFYEGKPTQNIERALARARQIIMETSFE